ncbi:MAG: competence/damage-inducible protein A [Bacteroidetes bacterium]|nr:competence/damage-inducible protein A [Bacteroidota bacterium]
MKVEIINIGDELLIGQVVNTNAAWMAEQLVLAGISVDRITVVADQEEAILDALREAEPRSDVVLVTGGLGPTPDDSTKGILCRYFNTKLVFHEDTFRHIREMFPASRYRITKNDREQAMIPEICEPLRNFHGTAPGMWFERNGKIMVFMPGVPFELKPLMSDFVIPRLKGRTTEVILNKTVLTQGVGESYIADRIAAWEKNLPAAFKLAYLPQPGIVRLRLTARGNDRNVLQSQMDEAIKTLQQVIPEWIFGYDDDTLEAILADLLTRQHLTLSTAESCTGGYIAHLITSVPGSSRYYKGSVVAYANEIKEMYLGVTHEDLITHGAVSEQVVCQMALGVKARFQTEYAVATTGIAGPDGGSPEKPVGLTWIAVAGPDGVIASHFRFGEHRERNIRRTALTAMNMLRKTLVRVV